MRADDAEVVRLRRELAKTRAERDILRQAIAYFADLARLQIECLRAHDPVVGCDTREHPAGLTQRFR
jgi:hypothetical protein